MVKVLVIYIIGVIVFDYACYFQAAIFLGLERRFPSSEIIMDKVPYRPLNHVVFWIIGFVGLVDVVAGQLVNGNANIMALFFASAIFLYFVSRYIVLKQRLLLT